MSKFPASWKLQRFLVTVSRPGHSEFFSHFLPYFSALAFSSTELWAYTCHQFYKLSKTKYSVIYKAFKSMLNSTFNNVLNHQAISQDRWLKYLYEPTSPKDNYRTLHPATAEYNLKLTWNVLQIVHMLVHKTNIKNF